MPFSPLDQILSLPTPDSRASTESSAPSSLADGKSFNEHLRPAGRSAEDRDRVDRTPPDAEDGSSGIPPEESHGDDGSRPSPATDSAPEATTEDDHESPHEEHVSEGTDTALALTELAPMPESGPTVADDRPEEPTSQSTDVELVAEPTEKEGSPSDQGPEEDDRPIVSLDAAPDSDATDRSQDPPGDLPDEPESASTPKQQTLSDELPTSHTATLGEGKAGEKMKSSAHPHAADDPSGVGGHPEAPTRTRQIDSPADGPREPGAAPGAAQPIGRVPPIQGRSRPSSATTKLGNQAGEPPPTEAADARPPTLETPRDSHSNPMSTRPLLDMVGKSSEPTVDRLALSGPDQARFVQRVARAAEVAHNRGGPIRLRLSPPELGSLRLEVRVEAGALTVRFEAEAEVARTVLLENVTALRERLAEQGVRVEQFDVDLMDRQTGSAPDDPSQRQRPTSPATDQPNRDAGEEETEPETGSATTHVPAGTEQLDVTI